MDNPATILILLRQVDCVDGVSAYLETVITGLQAVGDRIVLVSGPVSTPDGSDARRGIIQAAVVEWLVLPDLAKRLPTLALIRRLRAAVRSYDVDVVSPQGFASLPFGVLLGLLTGRAVVANYHPSLHGEQVAAMTGRRSLRERLAFRGLATAFPADRFIAMSSEIVSFFRGVCGIPAGRIHKQMLGVDTDYYHPPSDDERQRARRQFGLGEALVAVLPGRVNLNKGHDLAVAAIRLLRERRPDVPVVCLFPGGGSQRAQIEAAAIHDDADRQAFRFLGFVSQDVMRDTYFAADIVLLPSRMEGFGLVVAEAMCCGAIVIRTPSGGWQDQVVEGVTGHMVPFNDADALACAIVAVFDDPARATMREAAIAHAMERFSKRVMVAGTSRLYREMAGKRGSIRLKGLDATPAG